MLRSPGSNSWLSAVEGALWVVARMSHRGKCTGWTNGLDNDEIR